MKFDCNKKSRWHSWFAWRPVKISTHDCRWLERVARKKLPIDDIIPFYEYEPIEQLERLKEIDRKCGS